MNQTEIGAGRGVFSVRNGAILGGIATALGYLLLIIWTVVNREGVSDSGRIIARGVFGCALGLLALGLHSWLERNARLIAVAVTGLVLLLLQLLAPARLELLGNGAIMFGFDNGALGFGFALAVFTMACLVARRDSPENAAVRYASLGLGIAGTLLYLVAILVALAENRRSWNGLGAVFGSGNVPLIIFSILFLLGLLGVLVLGLIAGTKQVTVKSVCQWGISFGLLVFYLTVGYIFLNFFVELMKYPERVASHILALMLSIVAGVGTLFGSVFICVASLGRVIELVSEWQQWGFIQQLKAENSPTDESYNLTPPSRITRSKPASPATGSSSSPESQLQTLKTLHEQGLISQDEYAEKRAEILRKL